MLMGLAFSELVQHMGPYFQHVCFYYYYHLLPLLFLFVYLWCGGIGIISKIFG